MNSPAKLDIVEGGHERGSGVWKLYGETPDLEGKLTRFNVKASKPRFETTYSADGVETHFAGAETLVGLEVEKIDKSNCEVAMTTGGALEKVVLTGGEAEGKGFSRVEMRGLNEEKPTIVKYVKLPELTQVAYQEMTPVKLNQVVVTEGEDSRVEIVLQHWLDGFGTVPKDLTVVLKKNGDGTFTKYRKDVDQDDKVSLVLIGAQNRLEYHDGRELKFEFVDPFESFSLHMEGEGEAVQVSHAGPDQFGAKQILSEAYKAVDMASDLRIKN